MQGKLQVSWQTVTKLGSWWRTLLLLLCLGPAATRSVAEVQYWPQQGSHLWAQHAEMTNCAQQLLRTVYAAYHWSMDNADVPPASLEEVAGAMRSPADLFCPANFEARIPATWSEVAWDNIDYLWSAPVDWNEPAAVVCRCRIHQSYARAEGTVVVLKPGPGWPAITLAPMDATATPGEPVSFHLKSAPDTLLPVSFQWRSNWFKPVTNIVCVTNPGTPPIISWQTNIGAELLSANLPGATNSTLHFPAARTSDSGYYSATISNSMGITLSGLCRLSVAEEFAGLMTNALWTDAYCSNNLRQISMLARLWFFEHRYLLPRTLAEMTNSHGQPVFGWPNMLYCRSDAARTAPDDWRDVDFSDTSYEALPGRGSALDPFCRCRVHGYYADMNGAVMLRPEIQSIKPVTGGAYDVRFRVFAGRKNLLEASTDLVNWTVLANFGPEAGDRQFLDYDPFTQRFYRLRLP